MVDNKYDKKLAVGTVAAVGTLAALIPPSAVMVMFAIFTEQSVGTLLIAGIVPGAITAVLYIIMLVIRVHVNPTLAPQSTISIPWRDRISSLGNIWGIVIVIAVMFGGIYSGMMTPTEAGGAGALCTFILVIARRRFNTRWLMNSFAECTRTCAMVLILLVTAVIFGRFMAVSGVSGMFADFIIGLGLTPTWIIVMFLVLYVFLGMFLEAIGIMALSLPIIFPVVESLGFNGILFGILTVKMIEVGMLTPPMGLNVYTVKGTLGDKVELTDVFLGCLPFLLCDAILIVILLAFPQVALWLPGSMGK